MTAVFISYRGADTEPAKRIAQAIRDAGHDVYFAEWAIGLGDSIVDSINAGLAGARALVLCLSASATSDWSVPRSRVAGPPFHALPAQRARQAQSTRLPNELTGIAGPMSMRCGQAYHGSCSRMANSIAARLEGSASTT